MQNDRIQQGKRSPNNFGTPSATLPKNSRTSETEAKRTNKTRSKVWEKVAWFTKRSKNVKEGKTTFDRGKKENEVCLNAGESKCLTQQHDCAVCSVRKLKLKQNGSFYKTKSFSSLKKRKDRQLKERTAAFHCTEHTQVPVCHCDTATGTFHDFGADRRVSGRSKIIGSCNVLSEIAREMNCPPKVNAVDIDYSKSNCDRDRMVPSCSVERNRCYAFSGHVYNSWPRKKRSNVCPSAKDTLSPPVKQKRLGVKKTASFNGFDSLGKSNSNESTPFLLTNQIKNQRGFEIGVIHFYKSPKRQENTYKWEKLEKESCEQQKEKADTFSGSDESHLCRDKLLKGDSKGTLQQCMENLNMGDKEMLLEVMNKSGTPEQLCNISYTHLLDPSYDCKKKNSCDTDIDPDVESENTMEGTMYSMDMVPKEFKCTRRESSAALQDSCSKVSFEDYIDKQMLNDSNHTISNSVCSDRMDEKASTFCIESHCKTKGSFCNTRSPCRVQHDIESPVKKGGIGLLHLNQKQDENQEASQGRNFCCLAPTCNFNQSSGLSSSNNFDLTSDKGFSTDDSYFKDYSKCDTTKLPAKNLICHEIGTLEEINILPSTETNDSEIYIATGEPNNAAVWLQSDTNELPGRLEESACCSESEVVPPSLIIPEKDDLKEKRESLDNTVVQQMTNLKSIPSEICGKKIKPDFREDNSLKIDFADNISVVTSRGSEKYVSIQTLAEKDIPSVNVAQVDRHLINSERLNATKLSNVLQPACNFRDLYQELQFNSEIPFPRINFNNDRSSENSVLTQELTEKRVVVQASPPKVSGTLFKQQLEVMLQWFQEFNHEQRNILLRKVLDHSELPQMHMLSVAMEPLLHKSCPPDCQDMLAWLPNNVTFYVMCLLDPVSLCRCCQVNKHWNGLASNPILWERLCSYKDWQLSRPGEQKQMTKFIAADGNIEWKKMFAERFLLRRNWLKGKCIVRTFKGHAQGISCVQFDDSRIVSGSSDKTIRVWDIHSGEPDAVLTLAGHSGTVRCLNLNCNRLVSGSTDRSIKVWDLSFESYWSGASCKVTMVGHMHTVRCLQVDDNKVVSGSYDKTLKVWSIKTGQCRLTLRGHNAAVLCVQFDDKKIVSGSYDKTIKVWSLSEGSCLMTLTGHHDAVTCLNLTFDGRKVISGSLDHNLKFWDLFTGKCIGTLDWIRSEGHTGVVRCLQADSWRIVSAGDDKTLKVWCLETGQRLLTLRWHTDGVTCLHFNDHRIVSGSYDKTVKLWDFTPVHPFLELEK